MRLTENDIQVGVVAHQALLLHEALQAHSTDGIGQRSCARALLTASGTGGPAQRSLQGRDGIGEGRAGRAGGPVDAKLPQDLPAPLMGQGRDQADTDPAGEGQGGAGSAGPGGGAGAGAGHSPLGAQQPGQVLGQQERAEVAGPQGGGAAQGRAV